MTIKYHYDLIQGSQEWHDVRCGLLTASEMKLIVTPTKLEYSSNDKERAHVYELAAQRVTKYVEPTYIGDEMLRGHEEEIEAKLLYSEKYAPVKDVGFVTNDKFGFLIGCSPDGLVGEDGAIECKSRRQKFNFEAIAKDEMPVDFRIQVQTHLLVLERPWIDFISYSGGMPMYKKRIEPEDKAQKAIEEAARLFEEKVAEAMEKYKKNMVNYYPTERKIKQEMFV